jgi:hypothetical protein
LYALPVGGQVGAFGQLPCWSRRGWGELMAHRYRVYPTAEQAGVMLDRHCADARFVWNLAVEQFNWGRSRRPAAGPAERMRQLAEARQEFAWLGDGSSSVQQQALRDFDRAVAGFFARTHRCPTWRRKHLHEGFCVRDTKVRLLNRKWAELHVPKLGFVRFRLSRPLRQENWAWPASPATKVAGGTSRFPRRKLRCPARAAAGARWVLIGVWPPHWRPPMVGCGGRR